MDNVKNERNLSFPQKNWLLLCILVAIISPIVVDALRSKAHNVNYYDATHPIVTDSSYKMSSSPGDSGNKAAGGGTPGAAGTAAGGSGGAATRGSAAGRASGAAGTGGQEASGADSNKGGARH